MTKRKGYIYDKLSDWEFLKEAQSVSCRNKGKKKDVIDHQSKWIENLVEIQQSFIDHTFQTGRYHEFYKRSGQNKLRHIAELDFHPSHIAHQAMAMLAYDIIEPTLIEHTYASRKGYGQHKAAIQLNKWVQRFSRENGRYPIYLQIDIVKCYENTPHSIIRHGLERKIKDKAFIDAFIEPFTAYSKSGRSIPLGIPPSQISGNIALSPLDRYIKEVLRCHCYLRYLDDAVLLCRNRGEAHRFENLIRQFLNPLGYDLHVSRIAPVSTGIDFMGYVTYPYSGQFLRTSNKKSWLRRRSKVTNKRRLREIDAAAWAMLKHGNEHCKKLFIKYSKNNFKNKKTMEGINPSYLGFKRQETRDKNGLRILDAKPINMSTVIDQPVVICDLVANITTKNGCGRMALIVEFYGQRHKLIINSPMKTFFEDLWNRGVTRLSTVFTEPSSKHYDYDHERTKILAINNRPITSRNENGQLIPIYQDTGDMVIL